MLGLVVVHLKQFFSGMNQNVFVEMTICCAGEVISPTTRWSLSWMGLHVNLKVWSFLMRQPHNRQKGRWLEFHPSCLAFCKVVGLPTIWVEFQPGILRVQLWWWQDYSILKKSFIFWALMISNSKMKKSNGVQKGNVHSKVSQNEFSPMWWLVFQPPDCAKNANLAKIPRRCEAFSFELP